MNPSAAMLRPGWPRRTAIFDPLGDCTPTGRGCSTRAAYHCQQAAEKALKAFLSLHDIPFQRTHLLSPLVLQCMQRDPEFETLEDAAEALTPFATAFRYPGDPADPDPSDVAEVIDLAQAVVEFVSRRLPPETRPSR